MTLSFWQQADLGPEVNCDVAVVGGGIIGASTAYWLKRKQPGLSVALVEAQTVGAGATGRNAGFLLQGASVDYETDVRRYGADRAEKLWDFTLENRRLIAAELDASRIHLEGTGSVLLAGDTAENERLQASAEFLGAINQIVDYWDATRVTKETHGVGYEGGLYIASGACLNSLRLVREIAGRSDARVLEHHPVYDLQPAGDRIAVRTARRRVLADRVILALNAYLPLLLPETKPYVRPIRAQMFATKPIDRWLAYPVYTHEGYYYLRQLPTGELLVGGARHLHSAEEVGYEDRATAALQNDLWTYLLQHFPHLRETLKPENVYLRWSGVMGFTPDGLPAIGRVQGAPQCLWAAGFNGHGMGYGFRFGKLLASLFDEAHPADSYAPIFSVDRFT